MFKRLLAARASRPLVLLLLLFATLPALANATPTLRAVLEAQLIDIDHSQSGTCGDEILYTLTISNSSTTENLLGVEFNLYVDPNSFLYVDSVTGDGFVLDATPSHLALAFGDIPTSATAGSVVSSSWRVRINDPNSATSIFAQGFVTGTNFPLLPTDSDDSVELSPTIVDYEPCPAPAPAADLGLSKSDGGLTATPGSTIVYTLTASNSGPSSATSVVLFETVPTDTTFNAAASSPGWTCTGTSAGSSCQLFVGTVFLGSPAARLFALDLASGTTLPSITNTAQALTTRPDPNPSNNTASDTTPIALGNPDLRLLKSLSSGSPAPGGTLVYALSLTNLGNRAAAAVNLSETVPVYSTFNPSASSSGWLCSPNGNAGSSCSLTLPDVAAGATLTRTFAVTLPDPLPAAATSILNTACSSTSTPGDPQSNNCATTTTPTTGSPSLSIAKTDAGISAAPGDFIAYTITYSNGGPGNAPGVLLTETVPAQTTFNAAASSPGWTCSPGPSAGSTCILSHGALVAGASGSKAFAVQVSATLPSGVTQTTNTVTISSSAADDPSDNTATDVTPLTPGAPNLSLTKTLASGSGVPGSLLVYDLTVLNSGNRAAEPLDFIETVPDHTIFDPASSSSGWTCTPNNSQGATCTLAIPSLAPGISATRAFAAFIVNPLPAGVTSISNTACVSTPTPGNPPANDCSTILTPASGSPRLDLVKSIASGSATPGATLTYSLTVTNVGNQAATAVVLSETVPAHTVFSAGASSPGWTCTPDSSAGASCSLPIGSLAGGGASASRSFAVVVENPLPAGADVISNTACASSASLSSCDDIDAPTGASPFLSISKSLQSGTASPGNTLTYSLVVQNTGNQTAATVFLTETVPLLTTFVPAASSAGWTCSPNNEASSTCSLPLGPLGAGASSARTFAVQIADPLPAGATSISNTACAALTAAATGVCDEFDTPVDASPVLNIVKTLTSIASPGAPILYSLVVQNSGNQHASGVAITDQVPTYSLFDASASSPGWTCTPDSSAGSACSIAVGDLPPGRSLEVIYAVRLIAPLPAQALTLTNLACVTDDLGGSACSSVTTPIAASPDLLLSKVGPSVPLEAGQVLLYSLYLINNGNRSAADVTLTDTVPDSTTFNAAASSPGWDCPSSAPGTLCSFPIGILAPGASRTALFAVTAASPLPPGVNQISNTACAQGPDGTACDDATTPLPSFVEARLVDSLQTDHNGNGYPDPGDVLGYTLLVDNPSTLLLTDLVVTAELDPHLSLVEGSVTTTAGTAPTSPALLVTLPSLATGTTVTITFLAEVLDYPKTLRFLSSQGSVSGANFTTEPTDDPNTIDADDDPTLTPLALDPQIAEIPTLSELGLLLMILILSAIAFMTIRP